MVQLFSQSGLGGFFERITGAVASFFETPDSVLGVDIGSSAIKVVQLKKKGGKAELETYGELSLGPYADLAIGQATSLSTEKLRGALVDIMREASVTATSSGMAIPLASSLITTIDMLTTKGGHIDEMVPLEARKYIPVPITEVTLDWQIIPRKAGDSKASPEDDEDEKKDLSGVASAEEKVKVLLAAIHNETLTKHQQIGDESGLSVHFFEIEIFSLVRSLLSREKAPVFILDVGAKTSKLVMVDDGVVHSPHIINKGSQDITFALAKSQGISTIRAEEMKRDTGISKNPTHKDVSELIELHVNGIFNDANRVVVKYQQENKKAVSKIILSGGGSLLKGIEDTARQIFETEVERAHPFSKVEAPAFLEPALLEAGPNFAVALGAALRRLQEIG
jgi:type IV pilus assembly protein PilM